MNAQATIQTNLKLEPNVTVISGWIIECDPLEPNRIYLQREGQPGHIHIKAESEGLVTDV